MLTLFYTLFSCRNHRIHVTFTKKDGHLSDRLSVLALPIFPGRLQPSIVGASELNCRVRNGNGWTLTAISTNYSLSPSQKKVSGENHSFAFLSLPPSVEHGRVYHIFPPLSSTFYDPWESRTPVYGVRGRRLDHLTNGPWTKPSDVCLPA